MENHVLDLADFRGQQFGACLELFLYFLSDGASIDLLEERVDVCLEFSNNCAVKLGLWMIAQGFFQKFDVWVVGDGGLDVLTLGGGQRLHILLEFSNS